MAALEWVFVEVRVWEGRASESFTGNETHSLVSNASQYDVLRKCLIIATESRRVRPKSRCAGRAALLSHKKVTFVRAEKVTFDPRISVGLLNRVAESP